MDESPRPFSFALSCPWAKKSQDYAETWEGGFICHDSKGRKVYVIRRMINGRNYKVSTRATTLRAAMEQLKRFETDPEHYNPTGLPHKQPIYLDAPLAAEFLAYSRELRRERFLGLGSGFSFIVRQKRM